MLTVFEVTIANLVRITLNHLQEIRCFEDFKGGRYYSDIVLKELESSQIYVSLDFFGNSGAPHEADNLVIIAKKIAIEEKEKV